MRLAEAGTAVFAAISALSRANRASCDCTETHLHEANLAIAFAKQTTYDVGDAVTELVPTSYKKTDFLSQRLAEYIFGQGCYPFVHPIEKNMF